MFHASFTEIPPEILKIVCKTLPWQDIKCLEEILPSDLFIKSGVKSDVINRTLPLLKESLRKNQRDIKILEKKIKDSLYNYYFILEMFHNIDIHTIHDLLNFEFEKYNEYLETLPEKWELGYDLEKEYHEIFLWCNN